MTSGSAWKQTRASGALPPPPTHPDYSFNRFYGILKGKGFVIYPGKVTELNTFRIGNIGDITPVHMEELIGCVKEAMYWA
jgi:2-aminoethylphosphonate-pyruvate transaminase